MHFRVWITTGIAIVGAGLIADPTDTTTGAGRSDPGGAAGRCRHRRFLGSVRVPVVLGPNDIRGNLRRGMSMP
jgi:hypothetical protein